MAVLSILLTPSFEGNGHTIAGLYSRGAGAIGLFGATGADAEIRNVGLVDGASYGGAGTGDNVEILVGSE